MNRKSLIFLSLLVLLNLAAAQDNSNPIGDVLWYIGFGVGLILLAFVSETAYKLFSSLYGGGTDLIPTGGKVDYKADLKTKKKKRMERTKTATVAKSLRAKIPTTQTARILRKKTMTRNHASQRTRTIRRKKTRKTPDRSKSIWRTPNPVLSDCLLSADGLLTWPSVIRTM